jgi:hypothetical protein
MRRLDLNCQDFNNLVFEHSTDPHIHIVPRNREDTARVFLVFLVQQLSPLCCVLQTR